MKKLCVGAAIVGMCLSLEAIDDVLVTTPGECNFPADGVHQFGMLSNGVGKAGAVMFTQGGEMWNSFAGYTGVGYSTSVFDNVRFDFSGSGAPGNFFSSSEHSCSYRAVVLDHGAVVTNVGTVVQGSNATSSNQHNGTTVRGGSSLFVTDYILGERDYGGNYGTLTVEGGGHFGCSGDFYMSKGSAPSDSKWDSDNRVVVRGAGTTAKIGDEFSLCNTGAPGGNTLEVSDGAVMEVKTFLNSASKRGFGNVVRVTRGGVLTTDKASFSNNSGSTYDGSGCGDRFEVLDGGAYTNANAFNFGYTSSSASGRPGITLLVSNATFRTGSMTVPNGPGEKDCEVRISGPLASFSVASNSYYFSGKGCYQRWIIENGATFKSFHSGYTYTASDAHHNSIIVRTGATFTFSELSMGRRNYGARTTNGQTNYFVVASGATATGNVFRVNAQGSELSVSNATFVVMDDNNTAISSALAVGYDDYDASRAKNKYTLAGGGTNDLLSIWGDSPRVRAAAGGISVYSASTVRYHLPAAGYAEGCVPMQAKGTIRINANSALELEGAAEMLARHRELGKEGTKYVLMKAKTFSIPDSVLEATCASLPADVKLAVRNGKDGDKELVLQVGKRGLVMIVR